MTITTTFGLLRAGSKSLSYIYKLPDAFAPAVSYKIAKIIKEANGELTILKEFEETLQKKYSTPNEDGTLNYGDNLDKAEAEYKEFLLTEITLNASPLKLSDFDKVPTISGEVMGELLPFIQADSEDKVADPIKEEGTI